jgi:hypothetical protein
MNSTATIDCDLQSRNEKSIQFAFAAAIALSLIDCCMVQSETIDVVAIMNPK